MAPPDSSKAPAVSAVKVPNGKHHVSFEHNGSVVKVVLFLLFLTGLAFMPRRSRR